MLIIGILSAVALPQYKKAVLKARVTQAIVAVRAIATAQEAYYLANNEYATDADKLDISVSLPSGWWMGGIDTGIYVGTSYIDGFTITYANSHIDAPNAGKLFCWAQYGYPEAEKLCKSMSSGQLDDSGGGTCWAL